MRLSSVENEPGHVPGHPVDEDDKLLPSWSQSGDNQIIYLGLLVALILGLSWGCSNVVGGNDTVNDLASSFGINSEDQSTGAIENITGVDNSAQIQNQTPTTTAAALEVGDLQGAMDEFSVTGTVDGEQAILTGFVGTAQVSAAAEVAASRVPGITTVSNRLVILEPLAEAALESAGVRDVGATRADGTRLTAAGFVDDEAQRVAALAAVAGVDGVSGSVIDELVVLDADILRSLDGVGVSGVSVTVVDGVATLTGEVPDEATRGSAIDAAMVPGIVDVVDEMTLPAEPEPEPEPEGTDTRDELNALFEANPIQFNSGSAEIKNESFPILDQAVELLSNTEAAFEIQGYTDITGNASANQTLSELRAQAVLDYLVANGSSGDQLTSNGYGPTEEFGEGDSPDALAANRRVRFELT